MKKSSLLLLSVCVVLAGCSSKKPTAPVKTEKPAGTDVFKYVVPPKEVVDPKFGKEIWFAIGPVSGTKDVNANGVAQAQYMENGSTLYALQINILPAPKGMHYEGWAVKKGARENLGWLLSPAGDARHKLHIEKKKDLRSYTSIEVTLVGSGKDATKPVVQAKGNLVERKR